MIVKTDNSSEKPFFVFYFKDEDDLNRFIKSLEIIKFCVEGNFKDVVDNLLKEIQFRLDSIVCEDEEFQKTSFLYSDEASSLMQFFPIIAAAFD